MSKLIILILFLILLLSSCTPYIVNKCIDKCSPDSSKDWLWNKYCEDHHFARGEEGVKKLMEKC